MYGEKALGRIVSVLCELSKYRLQSVTSNTPSLSTVGQDPEGGYRALKRQACLVRYGTYVLKRFTEVVCSESGLSEGDSQNIGGSGEGEVGELTSQTGNGITRLYEIATEDRDDTNSFSYTFTYLINRETQLRKFSRERKNFGSCKLRASTELTGILYELTETLAARDGLKL